jgi:drug/metabolite transporter (DMT)-like permease
VLELCEGKLSRTVLRGVGSRKAPLLPGTEEMKRLIKTIVIIDGTIFALMAGVATLIDSRYGTLLFWAGVTVAMIGSMSAVGSINLAEGEYDLKLDQKIPQLNYNQTDDKLKEMNKSQNFGIVMVAAGAVSIAVGLILNKIITGG